MSAPRRSICVRAPHVEWNAVGYPPQPGYQPKSDYPPQPGYAPTQPNYGSYQPVNTTTTSNTAVVSQGEGEGEGEGERERGAEPS